MIRSRRRLTGPLLALLAAGLFSAACNREQATTSTVSKETPAPAPMAAPQGQPAEGNLPPGHPPVGGGSGMQGDVPPPPSDAKDLKWVLPQGWKEQRTGGIRFATLQAPVQGKLDISVTVLSGPAGGELANVNRWRGQVGLDPVDEKGLASLRKPVKAPVGSVATFFLEGKTDHMLVALVGTPDGNTWFVKMTGQPAAVAQARAAFMQMVGSLRVG